ncbi:MAG: ArsR family transcriptional regulator [Candidatus Korarchaeum sp.]|nr:ArsR family transcriptional regulator [Candidatus Korarchaeum sp.]
MKAEDIIEVLAAETRRKLLKLLAMRPLTLSEISEKLGISQPAVLKHIRELESSGIIEAFESRDQSGRMRRCYRISKPLRIIMSFDGDSLRIYLREAKPLDEVPVGLEERIIRLREEVNELENLDSLGELMYKSSEMMKEIENILGEIEKLESQLIWLRYEMLRSLRKFVSGLS